MIQIAPQHSHFVGIDSDGCVFDTMELKHKECFIPNIINYYELQAISKYARETAEFVNLYSKSRGVNRFPALIETFEWLQKRPEVAARGVHIAIPERLRDWIRQENEVGQPGPGIACGRDERSRTRAGPDMVGGRQSDDCRHGSRRASIPLRA